jgi:hypothetical protein
MQHDYCRESYAIECIVITLSLLLLLLLLQGGSFFNFSRLLLKVPEHTW